MPSAGTHAAKVAAIAAQVRALASSGSPAHSAKGGVRLFVPLPGAARFQGRAIDTSAHPAAVRRAGGSTFVIEALDNGPDRPYVASTELKGVPLVSPFLRHEDLIAGGTLTLHMSAAPVEWGTP